VTLIRLFFGWRKQLGAGVLIDDKDGFGWTGPRRSQNYTIGRAVLIIYFGLSIIIELEHPRSRLNAIPTRDTFPFIHRGLEPRHRISSVWVIHRLHNRIGLSLPQETAWEGDG